MMIVVLAACAGAPISPGAPSAPSESSRPSEPSGSGPVYSAAPAWEDNPDLARLVGFVTATSAAPTTLQVTVDDGARSWVHTADTPATAHRVRVLGLRPSTEHTLTVQAFATSGVPGDAVTLTAVTDPLPDDFPTYTVTSTPDRMEPGLTLLRMADYVLLMDAAGVVRWYLPSGDNQLVARATDDGRIWIIEARSRVWEIDLSGRTIGAWQANGSDSGTPVDVTALHHDILELPGGTLLGLSVERRLVDDYPGSTEDPAAAPVDATVAGDVVVEFARDGTVQQTWPLLDVLDPQRVGHDGLSNNHWGPFFAGAEALDWSHGNSLWFDEDRDEIVVSLRNQDSVVAIARSTGALAWIVAPQANWVDPWRQAVLTPEEPILESYHQHGAKITPAGTLMLFDNGNRRASAYEDPIGLENYSRGVEIALDVEAGTYRVVRTVGETLEPALFSGSLGNADPMPTTGNMLVVFGNVKNEGEDRGQVIEATPTDPPQVVFHLRTPRSIYRSERVVGWMPGF